MASSLFYLKRIKITLIHSLVYFDRDDFYTPPQNQNQGQEAETVHRTLKPTRGVGSKQKLCGICETRPANIIYLPCRHLVYCEKCDLKMSKLGLKFSKKCGYCRATIKKRLCLLDKLD